MTLTTDRDGRGPACRRAGRGFQCLPSLSGRGAGGEVFGLVLGLGLMSPLSPCGRGAGVRALVFACHIAAGCWSANLAFSNIFRSRCCPFGLAAASRVGQQFSKFPISHRPGLSHFPAPTRHRPGADAARCPRRSACPPKWEFPPLAHWVAGMVDFSAKTTRDLHIRHGPKTWTCPPSRHPVNGY